MTNIHKKAEEVAQSMVDGVSDKDGFLLGDLSYCEQIDVITKALLTFHLEQSEGMVEAMEVTKKALAGFEYLDNGQPKEMDLKEYARLVRDIYANGMIALSKTKEALTTHNQLKESMK